MSEMIMLAAVFIAVLVIGRYLIRRIPPLLHTPLMSMTNAVSGVTVLGALLLFRAPGGRLAPALVAAVAIACAAFNLIGGFCVTGRMLGMFKTPKASASDA